MPGSDEYVRLPSLMGQDGSTLLQVLQSIKEAQQEIICISRKN